MQLTDKGNSLTVKYKWTADVKDFKMPVKIAKAKNKFDFIYLTTSWQSITLKNIVADDFAVAEDKFYINVEVEEN